MITLLFQYNYHNWMYKPNFTEFFPQNLLQIFYSVKNITRDC